jgi:LacI family transcriptional regulator
MSITAVAKRAGVSIATVSRVLNDLPVVSETTANQVRAAIAEMGYTPLRVRRTRKPKSRMTGKIGIVAIGQGQGWLNLPVMASVVSGISAACRDNDQQLLLEEMLDERDLTPSIRSGELGGVLAFVSEPINDLPLLQLQKQLPVVRVMGGEYSRNVTDHVSADNSAVGYLAFEYLKKQGCDRFVFLTSNPNWMVVRIRAQAFANAAVDAGEPVEDHVVSHPDAPQAVSMWSARNHDSFDEALAAIASMNQGTTGIFAPTDFQTVQVAPLLSQHGLHLGDNAHLISCDNERIRLTHLSPRPPSIDLNGEEIGRVAVRQLMQRIAVPDAPSLRVQVSPRLGAIDQTNE